jgi:hypothetical protein
VSAKISDSQIVHAKMNFQSSDSGVRVIQIGDVASNLPSNGVMAIRISEALNIAANKLTATHYFSDAIDGNPAFTTTPVLCAEPIVQVAASSDIGPDNVRILGLNSVSALLGYEYSAAVTQTFTAMFGVIGDP